MRTLFKLIPCAACLCATLSAAEAPVVSNGGFENGLDGWSRNRGVTVADDSAAAGKKLAVLAAAPEARARLHTDVGGLVAGRTYELHYHSRRCTSTDARVLVRDIETSRYLASSRPSDASEWKPDTLRFTAPAATVRLEVRVAAGKAEVDHFSIAIVD